MKVKIENTCVWEGKRYEKSSVIEVPAEIAAQNPWMKPTDDDLSAPPLPKEEKPGKDIKGF